MIRPHRTSKGMVFAVTEWGRSGAFEVRSQPETQGIPSNLDPEMTTGSKGSPFEKHHRAVFLKRSPALKQIFVDGNQHFRQAAFSHHPLRVLTLRLAPGLSFLSAKIIQIRRITQIIFFLYLV